MRQEAEPARTASDTARPRLSGDPARSEAPAKDVDASRPTLARHPARSGAESQDPRSRGASSVDRAMAGHHGSCDFAQDDGALHPARSEAPAKDVDATRPTLSRRPARSGAESQDPRSRGASSVDRAMAGHHGSCDFAQDDGALRPARSEAPAKDVDATRPTLSRHPARSGAESQDPRSRGAS